MNRQFRISSLLPGRLAELHLSLPELLQRAGLPKNFFQREKICASTAELFALWQAVSEMSPDPAIGLKLGAEPRFERYQPSGIAAICSRSFRDALARIARYKQLTCPEEIRVQPANGETSVEFVYLQSEGTEPNLLVDICLSWILAIGQRGTDGRLKPLRVELTRPEQHRDILETHFGSPIRFQARRNALIFREGDLERPFVTQNADLLRIVGAQLESELAARNTGASLCEEVRHALKRSLAGKRPNLREVARELGTSARTLQRRLTGEGITFQQLVEETRRGLARHYLSQSTIELAETAYLLGYEDSKSFFRAFQLWEGTSPGQWRTQHQTA